MERITAAAARRAALAAQGFAQARPSGQVTRRHLVPLIERLRLLQLDSVNVAVRAHYMPVFSRLGAYPAGLLDEAAWSHSARRPRLMVEYWAHEASLLPVRDWPLLQSRAKRKGWWRYYQELVESKPGLVEDVLAAVKEAGPIGAGALEQMLGAGSGVPRPKGASWWERSEVKRICEFLFGTGQLTTGTRVNFQRLYDLPERVLPPEVLASPVDAEEAARRLIGYAATALGVATEVELRDYYRMGPETCRTAIQELVDAGRLEQVEVRGWPKYGYRSPGARMPRKVSARALLCPFDPLIWERARTERMFGFRYRIEIYTPAEKREHGYYVFPFLLDDALVARVDLKTDRAANVLRVPGAFAEPDADVPRVAAELAAELRVMADWLELDDVVLGERGDLIAPLARALSGEPGR
ncbi:winged helix-turn-helix domain-containing protein [Pseudonocardia spinosispora]|uniref:winged helix-turn-helix domain-containing protein n=1 Tax=Pseudonocardia spinosispora TaxID=103441 RepID=UPI0003FB4D83|nr:crosslink repair DNA glycosylase YcaQ family protein [Pseudonocardia spinosispora]